MKIKKYELMILFNGNCFNLQLTELFTLKNLIDFLSYNESKSLVEYNGKISNPKILPFIKLQAMDKIELITIVGGG